MAKPPKVIAAALVSIAFGVLVLVAGLLMIPALGVRASGSKDTLLTVIGSLGIVGGVLYVAAGAGLWKAAKWGWTLGIVATVFAIASAAWAAITIVDVTVPVVQLVVALLVLGMLVIARSSLAQAAAPPPIM